MFRQLAWVTDFVITYVLYNALMYMSNVIMIYVFNITGQMRVMRKEK